MLHYGSVPYLNARPLLDGLAEEVGPLRYAVPSGLAELLWSGEVDVALAPIVAAFEHPSLCIVPAGAVVSRGRVTSVLLFSRRPVADIRTVGLDTSSRTSAALVRVLFHHLWEGSPTFVPRDPDPDLRALAQDAALLIGDPALAARWDGPPPLDLGAVWHDWTGLPFVFAAWLTRDAVAAREAEAPLCRAAARGRAHLHDIAVRGAHDLGLDEDAAEVYLREHLSFQYGPAEGEGLAHFADLWRGTPGLGAD